MKNDISIVVASNDEEKLNSLLLDSLRKQMNVNYEIIIINGGYKSASAAYNAGAEKANADYIMFVHQDIVFNSSKSLFDMLQYKSLLDSQYALLGVAGVYEGKDGTKHRLMTIQNGPEKKVWSKYTFTDVEEIFSVDECAFIMKKDLFMKYKFSDIGNTWHFYAVELCLHLKRDGYKIGVIPADLWHCSIGTLNADFFMSARVVTQKYMNYFPKIYSTCITIDTSDILWKSKLIKAEAKRRIIEKLY